MEQESLRQIILSHFDQFQRRNILDDNDKHNKPQSFLATATFTFDGNKGNYRSDAETRATMIRKDISYFKRAHKVDQQPEIKIGMEIENENSNEEENALSSLMNNLAIEESSKKTKDEIIDAIAFCVDSAFILAFQNVKSAEGSIQNVFELASVLGYMIDAKDGYICDSLLNHVSKYIQSKEDVIRAKACMFYGYNISYLLSRKASALSFRENSLKTIFKLIHPRLLDKSQNVRLNATNACMAISATNSISSLAPLVPDFIVESLTNNSQHDSSFAIRASSIKSLPLDMENLHVVIGRIRDVKEKVRIDALNVLIANKAADVVQHFSVEDRIQVLRNGLSKRCFNTYKKTVELVCTKWLKSVKFDPLELLRLLDPFDAENEIVCESMVYAIFSIVWDDDANTSTTVLKELSNPEIRALKENMEIAVTSIKDEDLQPAHAIFLRVKCATIRKSKQLNEVQKLQEMQKIFVDVPTLCETILFHLANLKKCIKERQNQISNSDNDETDTIEESHSFICLQLLKLSRFTDLQEEGSRRHFFSILHGILTSVDTPDILVESCLHVMYQTHASEADFVNQIYSILQDILKGSTETEKMDSIETQIMVAETEIKLRMASILSAVLEKVSQINTEDGNLNSFHALIMPMVTSENVTLKEAGVSCLGKFALLSGQLDVVERFQSILLKLANNPREKDPVRAQAALSLCDLAILFQPNTSNAGTQNDLEENMMALITVLLDHQEDVMIVVAAEICIKLMIADKLHNAEMLSKLLVMYFDTNYFSPTLSNYEDWMAEVNEVGSPTRLLQMLCVFFPAYSMTNETAQNTLIASIKPLLVITAQRLKDKKTKATILNAKKMVGYIHSLISMEGDQDTEAVSEENRETEQIKTNTKTLLAMIMIAETLAHNHSNFTKTFNRSLCKVMGSYIGALETVKVDEKVLNILKEAIEQLFVIDDEQVTEEFNEMTRSLETMKAVHDEKSDNKDKSNQGSLIHSLHQLTLEGPKDVGTNKGSDRSSWVSNGNDSTVSLRRSSRLRKSTESIQSTCTSHTNLTTKRSGRRSIESICSDIQAVSEHSLPDSFADRLSIDLENTCDFPHETKKGANEDNETRRILATLNK